MRRVISLWLPRFATDRLRRSMRAAAGSEPGPRKRWRSEPRSSEAGEASRRAAARADERPLVTTLTVGGRALVAAVDERASAAGIPPGLPLADARALAPDLDVRPADPVGDRAVLAALAEWCGRYSPWTAIEEGVVGDIGAEGTGIWLDVTGCAHLFGGEAALLDDLLGHLRRYGYAAQAALAETPGAAWALARFGDSAANDASTVGLVVSPGGGLVLAPGGARGALAPLPVAALRLAPATAAELARLGLRRIADLYPLPRAMLARRFGALPGRRLDQALGAVAEPISPLPPPAAQSARLAFAEPIVPSGGLAEALTEGLRRLTAELCRSLAEAALGARRLELILYRVDGSLGRSRIGTSRPSRDPAALQRLLAERLDGLDAGFGIEAMVLTALETEPLAALQLGFVGKPPSPARPDGVKGRAAVDAGEAAGDTNGLAPLIDRLSNRLGFARIIRVVPRESHLPERAAVARPALDVAEAGPWRPMPPRPLRLLVRPEPVEATALLPDHPPAQFRWRARLHRVAHAVGPERIAPEWWRAPSAATPPGPIRDYFHVEDEDGRRFWLYREDGGRKGDGADRWYLHGLFG